MDEANRDTRTVASAATPSSAAGAKRLDCVVGAATSPAVGATSIAFDNVTVDAN